MTRTPHDLTAARQGVVVPAYEELDVPVPGGKLAVSRRPADDPGAPVVLALHGITANGVTWARVAHHLAGRVTLVAPDLRGRGRSGRLPGPYGIAAHADDMAAVVDALGVGRVVLTGHSMGAFTAALTAVRHPHLLTALLLVDGGVGFPVPAGLDPDELITSVIGPAMRRLSMTFPDREATARSGRGIRPSPARGGRGWTPTSSAIWWGRSPNCAPAAVSRRCAPTAWTNSARRCRVRCTGCPARPCCCGRNAV
ncbi:alpha/beta fold hydrolase [Streptomyces sp. MK7]|uniref:alpha/beta fold hydrolase n=1 Tax=Streptomyces sp. MK7 TaxID=3067635 RepID=UPI00292FA9D8|nr:alpha/beta fold hydrolase [Streptomyces sp. MK7]